MARASNRGGYRAPARPAAASPPGALSQRTDGGPGDRQPIRVATGQPYGQAGQLADMQRAAPVAKGRPSPSAAAGPLPPSALPDAFRPTQRPGEDPASGLSQSQIFPDDPSMLIRALYALYPHPDIARLIG